MSRIPPRLLYLIVYNPSLQPPESAHPDDEDAQEQAHVLFYTANDHAVSKDRVLRQVGLAKALANFTTIFDPRASCDSIHSQSRRMVILSPEPDYWIHACLELEKVPRVSRKEEKGKAKQKEPVYDYNEASVHDAALRNQLLLIYESFKLTHGSFTSILNGVSKEALELQLDRFFTVWAWRWDLGKQVSFADYLGIRVHPLSTQLMPLIDVFEDKLPPHYFPIVLISSCLVASKSTPSQFPPALIRYLLRILEVHVFSRQAAASDNAQSGDSPSDDSTASAPPSDEQKHSRSASKTFLGVPGLNMNMNVRKWNWPGYLTFGMVGSSSTPKFEALNANEATQDRATAKFEEHDSDKAESSEVHQEATVDSQALEDALSSDADSKPTTTAEDEEQLTSESPLELPNHIIPTGPGTTELPSMLPTHNNVPNSQDSPLTEPSGQQKTASVNQSSPNPSTIISFSECRVHLSGSDPLDTRCRLIRYLCMDNILFALVPTPERTDDALDDVVCQDIAERSIELIERLKEIVEVEQEKIASAFSSSPVQNVLQKSQHVIATPNQLTYSSVSFSATSWHLHEGKKALSLHPDMSEIYSRGQSPQDWHLVKRGLGTNVQGDVFMEIGRKEASLVDVDNEITGVLRRFAE